MEETLQADVLKQTVSGGDQSQKNGAVSLHPTTLGVTLIMVK